VDKGIADWGIVGSDVYNEYIGASKKNNLVIMKKFENEVCKFMIAGKQNKIQIKDLNNKNIATSYPNMLKSFLTKNKIKATIKIMNGSIEAAIDMQYADFICDLVSSGETLKNNGLRPLITVTDIYPVLIKNKKSKELICK
jgi:ATP phosphoribosyltransferase